MGKIVHGHTMGQPDGRVSAEYRAYHAMKNRCLNPNQARYKDYGGRGITVCDRWLQGDGQRTGFQCFLADVGERPSASHSIDRRDNDRGYDPENVKWSTRSEQARNSRNARLLNIAGVYVPVIEAIERWGVVEAHTVHVRLHRGWADEDAVLVPKGMRQGEGYVDLWPSGQ